MFESKIFKDLLAIGTADIIGLVIVGIFWFYIAANISPAEFGEIQYFIGVATISSSLSLIGGQNTITVFIAKNMKVEATFYFISLIVGGICSLILWIIFMRVDASLLVFGLILNVLIMGDLLGNKDFRKYTKFFLLQKIIMTTGGLATYFLFGSEFLIYSIFFSYLIFSYRIYESFRNSKIDFIVFKLKKGFIINNYLMMAANGINTQIDRLIILPIFGYELLGNYSLGQQILGLLTIIPGIVFKYLLPNDSTGIKNTRLRLITIIISVCLVITGVVVLPLLIPLFFKEYIMAIEVIQVASLSILPITINTLYVSRFMGNERSSITLFGGFIKLGVMTVATVILGMFYGIVGIAYALVLASVVECMFYYISSKRNN
jgi:O-antigen/teichoic acid export membrane protein